MVTLKDIFDVDYPVSEAVVKRVMGLVREMNVSKRTFIIEQGQPTDSLFFIIDGLVRCVHTRGGEEETFLFATSGDPFTSIHSMSRGEPSQFSWQALDDTRLLALKFSDFEKLLAEEPEIHCWWSKALLDELYVLERRYVWIGNDSALRDVGAHPSRCDKPCSCEIYRPVSAHKPCNPFTYPCFVGGKGCKQIV